MKKQNPTGKQHVVPKFYLRQFADQDGILQALDLKNKRFCSPRPYQARGYLQYFYAAKTGVPDDLSQHIEDWLQKNESAIAPRLPRVIEKILNLEQVTSDDRYALAVLMSLLWLRSPAMREQLNRMEEDMMKQLMRRYPLERLDHLSEETGISFSEAERDQFREMIETGDYRLEFNNAQHLQFMIESLGFGGPGFANMFFGMKWRVYIAKGKRRFITTDSPVVEWCLPPKTFYGASFLERNKYFALTPEVLFELTYPIGSKKFKRVTLFESDDDQVMVFNCLLASHALHFAYSGERKILADMLSGVTKPGSVEMKYYDQYERPWIEHRRESARRSLERRAERKS